MPNDSPLDGSSKNRKRLNDTPLDKASTNAKRARQNIIEISSDEDDNEQVSKDRNGAKPTCGLSSDAALNSNVPKSTPVMQNHNERKKLESERLARQRAREQFLPNPTTSDRLHASQSPSFKNYWNSTIKTTFNRSYPDTSRTIRINDIIGPRTQIKMAIVSSYVVDLSWIHGLFEPKTPVMVIRHHAEPGTFKVNERENLFLCHPPMLTTDKGKSRAGCMHIKFFIIFYHNFCRVAIPTANAVDFDYETIENSVWIQDFRLSADTNALNSNEDLPSEVPPFLKVLENLLDRMGVPSTFRQTLKKYDFRPAAANLVVSVQGDHPLHSAYGQMGLAKEITSLGLKSGPGTARTVALECQGSSIGGFDMGWLKSFYRCASGHTPSAALPECDTTSGSDPPISVLFPTLYTVKRSINGMTGGGTIFCNRATWQKPNFPTQLFADATSKRPGVLMHVKMILGLFTPESGAEQASSSNVISVEGLEVSNQSVINHNCIGFLYLGSHNFTPAAWGRLSQDDSKESLQLEISNWELGVLLPITSDSQVGEYVPWQRPVKKYGYNGRDSKIPWMQFSHGR